MDAIHKQDFKQATVFWGEAEDIIEKVQWLLWKEFE